MIATAGDEHDDQGKTLRDRLNACFQEGNSGIPILELLRYMDEVAKDLDARHAASRVHADVRPDTIRVFAGWARLDEAVSTSESNVVCGAPAYLAPEAWRGATTFARDQYALACTYVELRTGHQPYSCSNLITIMKAHLEASPNLEGCSSSECAVLFRALAKNPAERFSTCRKLTDELRRAVT
jgi:serine/threonine-protein kinase